MSKILTVLLISMTLMSLGNCKSKPTEQHETKLSFTMEIERPFNYYWIVLDGQYEGDNVTSTIEEVMKDLTTLRQFIDQQNDRKIANTTKVENEDMIHILRKTNTNANSDLQKIILQPFIVEKIQKLRFDFSQMKIQIDPTIKLDSSLYIRLPSDRKKLAHFIDHLKSLITSSQNLNIQSIYKGSKDHYGNFLQKDQDNECYNNSEPVPKEECKQKYKQRMLESVDLGQLQDKIRVKADNYCKALGMNLHSVDEYELINYDFEEKFQKNDQDLKEQNYNEVQEVQGELQFLDQMTYLEAYQQINKPQQVFQFQNLFFEVNATCIGIKKISKKNFNFPENSRKNKVSSENILTGAELEKEINKLKNIKKSKK